MAGPAARRFGGAAADIKAAEPVSKDLFAFAGPGWPQQTADFRVSAPTMIGRPVISTFSARPRSSPIAGVNA